MKESTIQMTIPSETNDKLQERASQLESNSDWLLKQGIDVAAELDLATLAWLEHQATRLDLPIWRVIENLLVDRMAFVAADKEVNGPVVLLLPFTTTDDKLLTGKPLFDFLKENYMRMLKEHMTLRDEKANSNIKPRSN
jgi:hypothetical protein